MKIIHSASLRSSFSVALVLVISFVACLALPRCAFAQSESASVSGRVTDQSNAVVPDVEVELRNADTGVSQVTRTNGDGFYAFPYVKPGNYVMSVRKQSFQTVSVTGITLNVQDTLSRNFTLQVGSSAESITVTADSLNLNTTDGSVSTVVDRQFVENMPLNGRSLQSLIQLTPGVILTPVFDGGSASGAGQFSVNGQRTNSNYYTVDGAGANTGLVTGAGTFPRAAGSGQTPGTTVLGGTNSLVSLDALQEFRIETSSYSAEFGRTPGGQISLVTRSGTNQFHGSAYEYFRNEALDATDWFANANKQPKARERQNFFGGVLGGPIKQERFFFFASYEALRLQQPNAKVVTVPTVALRNQAVPALLPYLNALPIANGQDFGNGTAQFAASFSDPASFDIFALRLDGRLTDKLTAFFRLNHAPSESKNRISSLSTITNVHAKDDSYTGGFTWVAGPRITSDIRLNWTRNAPQQVSELEAFGGAVVPQSSQVFLSGRDPSTAYSAFGGPGGSQWIWGPGNQDVQRQFNVVGSLAWQVGAHQLKFGVDYRRLSPSFGEGGSGSRFEILLFSSQQAVIASRASAYQLTDADLNPREPIIENLSVFAQDAWHVSRKLTLTYGLRFERVPPPSDANGRSPAVVLGIESLVPQNPHLAPAGTPLWNSRFGEFAPRFGAAHQLSTRPGWETTVRGGVGTFYDLGLGNVATMFSIIYPFFASKVAVNVPFPLTPPATTVPRLVLDPPQQIYALEPNLRLPYTLEWNVSLQQAMGSRQSVTVGYVGAAGRRLLLRTSNRVTLPDWPTTVIPLIIQRSLASSRYNALQVQYERRLSRGFQATASYTLAKSTDNSSQDDGSVPASGGDLLTQEFGPSDFDVRHVLSTAVTYEVPKLSGLPLLRVLARDWGVDVMFRYQSALPVTPTAGNVIIDNVSFTRRVDLLPGLPLYIDDPTAPVGRRFNNNVDPSHPNCKGPFCTPPGTQQGNFPRNGLRGLPTWQADIALRREFKLRENVKLQLRGELFNLFNHPNFGLPATSLTDGNFGEPTSMMNRAFGGLNQLYQMGGPRSGELAVRIIF